MSSRIVLKLSFRNNILIFALLIVFGAACFTCTQLLYDHSNNSTDVADIPYLAAAAADNLHSLENDLTRIFHISEVAQQFNIPTARAMVTNTSSLSTSNIRLDVTSSHYIHDIAGKFVKIRGTITNLNPSNSTSDGGLAYISIVDIKEKIPVDLEDWSVEKGLYIPSLSAGQSLPLEWDVRLVKAGSYTVDILFNIDGDLATPPIVSSKISLIVDPKLNLNPGNVLPITFGVPAVLMATLGSINYLRARNLGHNSSR
ncbi:MAG: hypothetical protein WAU25_01310 [Nitrososphaeraceae archaeon]